MQRLNEYLRILKPIVSRDISKAIGRSHHSERDRMLAIGTRVPQSRHRDQRRCRQKGGGEITVVERRSPYSLQFSSPDR